MVMGRHTTLDKLLYTALEYGESYASDRRWSTKAIDDRAGTTHIYVLHHGTHMITVNYKWGEPSKSTIIPLDAGWRSRTDKQGINKILLGMFEGKVGADNVLTYDDLFSTDALIEVGVDGSNWLVRNTKPKEPEPKLEGIKPWTPPLRVEDTML